MPYAGVKTKKNKAYKTVWHHTVGVYIHRVCTWSLKERQPPPEEGAHGGQGPSLTSSVMWTGLQALTTHSNQKNSALSWQDGTRCCGTAQRRGSAEVLLIDSRGHQRKTTPRDALFIPSHPQSIFSVKAATAGGATIIFKNGKDALIVRKTSFDMLVYKTL